MFKTTCGPDNLLFKTLYKIFLELDIDKAGKV